MFYTNCKNCYDSQKIMKFSQQENDYEETAL